MPYLYCAFRGRGHETRIIEQQESYRAEGESVLIVKGKLKSGPHHCDKCNARLNCGDDAALLSAFPRHIVEGTDAYDFAYERRYFDMGKAEAKLYGADWPGVVLVTMRRKQSKNQA